MPPMTYSINDMPAFSAAFGSFQAKSLSTSLVNSLTTVCGLPSVLTITFVRSTTLVVSSLGARWYTDHKYWSMQASVVKVSVEVTASLPSGGDSGTSAWEESGNCSSRVAALAASLAPLSTRSDVLAVATCTGGVSRSSVCKESGNDSSRVPAELTASLVCARSEALTAATCAGTVSAADRCEPSGKAASVIAVTAVAADTASAFETLASPVSKPVTAAMTPPTRMTVPNNAVAVIATRRGFIAPSLLRVMLGPSVRRP